MSRTISLWRRSFYKPRTLQIAQKRLVIVFLGLLAWCVGFLDLCAADTEITLVTSVEQKYDDNINFSDQDAEADMVTALGAGINMDVAAKRTNAELNLSVYQSLFWHESTFDNTSEFASADVEHGLTDTDTIRLLDEFSHTYEPTSFEEAFSQVSGRYSYFRNSFDFEYEKDVTERFTAMVGYGLDTDITSRDDLIDSYLNRLSAEGSYSLNSKQTISAAYQFSRRDYDEGQNVTLNTLSASMKQLLTERLSLSVTMGLDVIESDAVDLDAKPMWVVTLTEQKSETTAMQLSYMQHYSTDPFSSDVFDEWRISAGIWRQLLHRLSGRFSVFYGQGVYEISGVEEDLGGGFAQLSYEISKNLTADVTYNYTEARSTLSSESYAKNVVSMALRAEF